MSALTVLIVAFIGALIVMKLSRGKTDYKRSMRIAMSLMLLFTSFGHFTFPEGMAMMIPNTIPCKTELVYITGIIEILFAIGLLISKYQKITGILLVTFFILILPANINAALKNLNYQKATFNGPGINYLWFRVPLQILFIVWTYFSTVKNPEKLT